MTVLQKNKSFWINTNKRQISKTLLKCRESFTSVQELYWMFRESQTGGQSETIKVGKGEGDLVDDYKRLENHQTLSQGRDPERKEKLS